MPYRFSKRVDGLQSSAIRDLLQLINRPGIISFAGGLPAADLFPTEHIASLAQALFASENASQALQYCETEGHAGLRERIAARLQLPAELRDADSVLVTQGSQQAIDLLAKLFLDPGDEVLVETPAYLGALQVFRFFGARITFLPCDDQGILPDALRVALQRKPKLLYMTPTFQNPSGLCYSAARRNELAALLAGSDTLLLEDDAYRDLWYDTPPPPPIGASLPAEQTAYLGSFSKTTVPGLRVGYLVAKPALVRRCVQVKQATDLQTNTLGQHLMFRMLGESFFDEHVAYLRRVYKARRDAFLTALGSNLSDQLAWKIPGGGMFVWATLKNGGSAYDLLPLALEEGLAFVCGGEFHQKGEGLDTLRLNFTHAGESQLREGVDRISRAMARWTPT